MARPHRSPLKSLAHADGAQLHALRLVAQQWHCQTCLSQVLRLLGSRCQDSQVHKRRVCLQIHGHDFSCAAVIPCPQAPDRFLFASGSEEKMIRVFEAPQAFADTLSLAQLASPQQDPNDTQACPQPPSNNSLLFPATTWLCVLYGLSLSTGNFHNAHELSHVSISILKCMRE